MLFENSGAAIILPGGQSNESIRKAENMQRALHHTALACAFVVALVGAVVLFGWLAGNEYFMAVLPGHIRMKANTAFCFVISGLALAAGVQPSLSARRWARAPALILLCSSAATLAEYTFKIDLHIDELLFKDPVQSVFPGRMAQISSICFCLTGLSILLLGRGRIARIFSQWAALSVGALAFVAIVSSLYGARILYGSIDYTSMALHTGVGFLVLGVGLLLAQPDLPIVQVLFAPETGGWLARRLLPITIFLPVVLGWIYLRPALDFGSPSFGMAMFAVTLGATGSAGLWFVAMFLNRTQRQQNEMARVREEGAAAVRQSERELRLVTDHLPTLLSYIDTGGRFLRVNRTYETWLGVRSDQIVGRHISEVLGAAFWESTQRANDAVLRGEPATFETSHPTLLGERRCHVTYAPDIDGEGQVRGIACMVLDIQERRIAEEATRARDKLEVANKQLHELATTDELTGLNNRRAFDDQFRIEIERARREGNAISILMIDIDNFKVRNDTWGHAAGDEALKTLAEVLRSMLRTPDFPARYGGEEFVTLLPGTDLSRAMIVAERIRKSVAGKRWKDAPLTVSIGVATLTGENMKLEQLAEAADAALYEAKRLGKNRVHAANSDQTL